MALKLTIELAANVARLQKDFEQARSSVQHFVGGVQRALSGLVPILSAGGLAYGLKKLVSETAEYGDAAIKASQKTGVAVEQISALRFAAEQSGLGFDGLQTALERFGRNISGVSSKGSEAGKALAGIGVSARDAGGNLRPMHDLLLDVAERFAKTKDGAGKTAVAMTLFGRAGAEMIPMLNAGRAGIEALENQATQLGIVFSEKGARAAQDFNDQLKMLEGGVHGLEFKIGNALIPALNDLMIRMLAISEVGSPSLNQRLKDLAATFLIVTAATNPLTAPAFAAGFIPGLGLGGFKDKILDAAAALTAGKKETGDLTAKILELQGVLSAFAKSGRGENFSIVPPEKIKKAKDHTAELMHAQSELAGILRELRPPADAMTEAWTRYIDVARQIAGLSPLIDTGLATQANRAKFAADETAALATQMEKVNDAIRKGGVPAIPPELLTDMTGQWARATDRQKADLDILKSKARAFGQEMSSAFTQMIIYGRGWGESLRSMLQLLEEFILKAFVLKNIGAAWEGKGGLLGILGSFFSGLAGRQGGGSVTGGRPYLVGERGPEIFVPSASGAIVPHAGASSIQVNYYTDARGAAPGTAGQIRRALKNIEDRAVLRATRLIHESALRRA
jgi:hypothetical protein